MKGTQNKVPTTGAELDELIKERLSRQKDTETQTEESPNISAFIGFTAEECAGMAKDFKKEFARMGYAARIIKYHFGYEIRYIRNGYNLTAFSEDLAEAKRLFIEEASA